MKLRRGFTLIEVLVVIGIIMFLSAFVIVAAVRINVNSREQATRALIQRIGMGITKYYGTYRIYPAGSGILDRNIPGGISIYEYLTPHDYNYTASNGTKKTKQSPLCMDFNSSEVMVIGGQGWVRDAWGKPIFYYAGEDGDDEAKALLKAQIGQFSLVSRGANGVLGDADDITLNRASY